MALLWKKLEIMTVSQKNTSLLSLEFWKLWEVERILLPRRRKKKTLGSTVISVTSFSVALSGWTNNNKNNNKKKRLINRQ